MSSDELREEQQIRAADRVKQFLADEHIQGAFKAVEERIYHDFKQSGGGDLHNIHARSQALDALKTELQAVVDAGTRATIERSRRGRRT